MKTDTRFLKTQKERKKYNMKEENHDIVYTL